MAIWMIVVMLIAASIFGAILDKIGLPSVVGQILAGIVLGPAMLHVVVANHGIAIWAEIGVLFLMFLAGIESDLDLLKRHAKNAVSVALSGVLTPFIMFLVFGLWLKQTNEVALLWAVLFSATSVSITAQILSENHQMKSKAGTTILGAAVLDDIIAIMMWTVYQSIFSFNESFQMPLWLMISLMFAVLLIIVLALKYLLPVILLQVKNIQIPGLLTSVTVAILLLLAITGEKFGVSGAIIAFIMGLMLTKQSMASEVEQSISVIAQSIFIPIFFVNIGLKVTLNNVVTEIPLIFVLTVLAVFTKWFGAYIGARLSHMNRLDANIVGIGMVSRGEMALIIADLALTAKIISNEYYAILTIVILLTTVLTPIILKPLMQKVRA